MIEMHENLNIFKEKYDLITENINDLVSIINQEYKIEYFNIKPLIKTLGHESDDLVGKSWLNYVHPDDLKLTINSLKDCKLYGQVSQELRLRHKNGSFKRFKLQGKEFVGRNEIKKFLLILRDITKIDEFKQIEQKLKESENKLQGILSSITDQISIIDKHFNIVYANENVKVLYGSSIEGAICYKIYHNRNDVCEDCQVTKTFTDGNVHHKECERLRKNGDIYFSWCTSSVAARDEKGQPTLVVEVSRDITEQKKAEEKIKHQAMLVESVSDAIISTDLDFNIISWNKAAESIYGWKADEIIGKNIMDTITVEYPYDDQNAVLKKFFEEGFWKGEVKQPRKDGNLLNMLSSVSLIRDNNGKPIGIVAINRDITKRKKADQELKESEEKFRTIAEQSLLGITIIQDKSVVFANQALSNILEYSVDEINKWSSGDTLNVIYEEDLPQVREQLKSRKKDDLHSILQYECRINTKLGNIKWVETISKPLIYQGRRAIILSLIDVTPKKEAEEELKEISKLKSELLSRASHELKTPLVSIKGYVDLLLNKDYEKLDLHTISILDEIKSGCTRLESLVKDLLATSKLESDKEELYKSLEDLSFLIRFCLRDLQRLIKSRNHKISLEIQDRMITMFEKERIYAVFINILSNALKYTPPNGRISIKSETKENNYIISVEDNGIGLTEEDKLKIFKKFGKIERYGQGLDVISEGTGLGLYISKKIVELHGGEIWVESEGRDKGSTFCFSLPIIKK